MMGLAIGLVLFFCFCVFLLILYLPSFLTLSSCSRLLLSRYTGSGDPQDMMIAQYLGTKAIQGAGLVLM